MDSREKALDRLRRVPETVRPGLAYVADQFRPGDAEGVATLFYRVYGERYPIGLYYDPDGIRQAVARGGLHPVVARLPGGEIVGFTALYASSPPFAGLLEFGLGMVHPAYRGSFVMFHLFESLMERLETLPGVQAVFGEAVCDTVITQHGSALFGFKECALELDLLPGTGSERIACLVMFRNLRDVRRRLFVPPDFAREIEDLAAWLGLDRDLAPGGAAGPGDAATRLTLQAFPHAGLQRANVMAAGRDFPEVLEKTEREAAASGRRHFQWFLNLADPASALAAARLREQGYRLGGLFPRWFDDDALMMYKLPGQPDLSAIHLYSDRARELMSMVWPG